MDDQKKAKSSEAPVHAAMTMAALLGVICLLAFFNGLFTLAPLDKTEALQIGIAETMLHLREWGVPQWNGHLYSDKPPLPYWLAWLAWGRFGFIPELARIPAALAATFGVAGLTWLTHQACRQEQPPQQSWTQSALAGSLLALSPGWIAFGRTAVHDIYLALAVMLALGGYALGFGLVQERHRTLIGALWIGLCCGVGFLAKGLLGIGLPLLIIAVDATLNHTNRRQLLRPTAVALFSGGLLTVVSPWAAHLIEGRHWAYIEGFLGFSHLQRATQAVDGHDESFLFYLPVLMGLLWPWWPMLVTAFQQLWKRRHHWRQTSSGMQRLQQLAAVWLVLGMALFSAIPTKLPGYILPLLPAAVLLISTTPSQPRWSIRLVALQLGLLSGALLLGLIGGYLDLLGAYGGAYSRLILSANVGSIWIALGGIIALATALYGGWRAQSSRQLPALLISMLLLGACRT